MIKSTNDLRPAPGRVRRQASTVAEMRAHMNQSPGSQLRLKCAKTGAWWFLNDRPAKFGAKIASRERKGFGVVEAYWIAPGWRQWRPISMTDVRRVYRITA